MVNKVEYIFFHNSVFDFLCATLSWILHVKIF